MKKNYSIYHVHSDISNLTAGTGADSTTKFVDYLDKAQELGMSSFAFSEHGSVINWIKKKQEIEKRGMKYIHANEIYLTQHIDKEKGLIRDNMHYMLLAKNLDGVKELNNLTSDSFKKDGHFYYNPRISMDELKGTSDNILMTSACLASPLWKLHKKSLESRESRRQLEDTLNWMQDNRHRMFFEIQYHTHPEQIEFNKMLWDLSKELNIPLIAGTDTHSLNNDHARARQLYLKSKGANYGDEDAFDLTFKSYDELVGAFHKQNALPSDVYLEAIENTNVMADMVETFELDKTPKYPKMYDKPIEVFQGMINEGVKKRGINKFPTEKKKEYFKRIKEEFETYVKLDTIDYMLLQKNIIDWCHDKEIYQGYGRGSVNGSLIAYVLGITEMDSIKHKLNFFRFLNPDRISLPDIDIDFPPTRRREVINYLASLEGVEFAEIITLNTKALKGSIRLVGKGLDMPLAIVDEIAKSVETFNGKDKIDSKWLSQYPELFEYVNLMNGVIESMGSHPSGFVVSPISLNDNISTLYTKESTHKVTSVNMKELDGENYVKLDILGLDNIELINETCKMANIERLTPDNIDTKDLDVWKSLRESTLGVFQFESESAYAYLKQLFSDETLENIKSNVGDVDYIDLLSLANGAIRPSGSSYRHLLAQGIPQDNGHIALNQSLSETLGYLVFQEQIMKFLTDFCEHTGAESDSVRRGLSKKEGTQQFLPKIEEGFIHYMIEHHGETEEYAKQILQSFLKVIDDASDYGFSINHSSPYSYTGYIGAYLRHYHPFEFLTVSLNLQDDDKEKTTKIVNYANMKEIEIKPIEFGKSQSFYNFKKDEKAIYKGLSSIKYLNTNTADILFKLANATNYDFTDWVGFLIDVVDNRIDTRQMEILIRLDFFSDFGDKETLLEIYLCMADKKKADIATYPQFADKEVIEVKMKKGIEIETSKTVKKPLKYTDALVEKTKQSRLENLREYELAVRANTSKKIDLFEQVTFEKDVLGYAVTKLPDVSKNIALVIDVNKKYKPKVTLYQVATGKEFLVKVEKKKFYTDDDSDDLLYVGDIIEVMDIVSKPAWKMVDGKFEKDETRDEAHLEKCKIIRKSKKRLN